MRKSKVLAKVRSGQAARLTMLGHFLPPFVAYAAQAGFDGIWLDLEHRNFDDREVQALLAFFHLYDIDCLVRPPTRDKGRLYRYLEDGASGLVIPHVADVEMARAMVRAVKFPPVGDRGLEGRGLESNFGLDIPGLRDPLVEHARRETFLLLQIETPDALAAANEMAALPGVDGLYMGPQDLRLRMLQLPEGERVSHEAALEQVAAACQRHGKLWGSLPQSADELRRHAEMGSQVLVWNNDAKMLLAGITQAAQDMDAALGG